MGFVRHELERLATSLLGRKTVPTVPKEVPTGYGIAQVVDNIASLEQMLLALANAKQLAVDAEGVSLGRAGKLCLLAVSPAPDPPASAPTLASTTTPSATATTTAAGAAATATVSSTTATAAPPPPHPVYLLDVSSLSSAAFHHTPTAAAGGGAAGAAGRSSKPAGAPPRSLKSLLECGRLTKLFFDVRADAEALFHQHGVALRGVLDLQLAEVAYRRYGPAPRRVAYVVGLSRAMEGYLDAASRARWQATAVDKRAIAEGYARDPQYWERRPLTQEQVRYASDDVMYLHHLHRELTGPLSPLILERVLRFSEYRVADSQKPSPTDEAAGAGPAGSSSARDAARTLAPPGL